MPATITRLVTLILLIAQVWFGMAPGRLVCLMVGPCDSHLPDPQAGPGGSGFADACCDDHEPTPNSSVCAGHSHGPIGLFLHDHDDCGCHVHVPAPAEGSTQPHTLIDAQHVQWRPEFASASFWPENLWASVTSRPALGRATESPPPRDALLGLKSTHLRL